MMFSLSMVVSELEGWASMECEPCEEVGAGVGRAFFPTLCGLHSALACCSPFKLPHCKMSACDSGYLNWKCWTGSLPWKGLFWERPVDFVNLFTPKLETIFYHLINHLIVSCLVYYFYTTIFCFVISYFFLCSRKYPYPSNRKFFGFTPPPSGNCSLASYKTVRSLLFNFQCVCCYWSLKVTACLKLRRVKKSAPNFSTLWHTRWQLNFELDDRTRQPENTGLCSFSNRHPPLNFQWPSLGWVWIFPETAHYDLCARQCTDSVRSN